MIVMPLIVRGQGVCVSWCLLGVDLCLFKVIGIKLDCESALNIGGQCVRLESRVEEVSQRAAETGGGAAEGRADFASAT